MSGKGAPASAPQCSAVIAGNALRRDFDAAAGAYSAVGATPIFYSRRIRRYAAYYRGWCQAFGEHEMEDETNGPITGMQWLFGEGRIGLILPEDIRKRFLRELVSRKVVESSIAFSRNSSEIAVNGSVCLIANASIKQGVERLVALVQRHEEIHMFLTHHLCYAPGTRIITFSVAKPLVIMYKEIEPLLLSVQ